MAADRPFPVSNSTLSFWRTKLDELDSHRSTGHLPSSADIVIIGAGYAGASITHHLLEKSRHRGQVPSIVILEAREACSGATGRNGGHLMPDPYKKAGTALDTHGKGAAEEIASFEFRNLTEVASLVERDNIDCDFVTTRASDVYLYEKGRDEVRTKLNRLAEANVAIPGDNHYSSDETAEGISGIKGAKGCVTHTSGHLWPYKLVLHLLTKAVEQGVNLQTHTKVVSISSDLDSHSCWTVETSRGTIKAKKIIFATNGYTSALLPDFKDQIVPVRGICSRIVSPKSHPPLLSNSYILRFNDWEYDYLIPRSDSSIIVGGARRDFYSDLGSWFDVYDDSKLIESAKNYFDGYMQRHFHGWEDSEACTEKVWTGIMGYSKDTFPYVGEVPGRPGQYICAGFTGHGMAQIFLSAKATAWIVLDGEEAGDVDLPRLYRISRERLESPEQHWQLKAYDAAMKQIVHAKL